MNRINMEPYFLVDPAKIHHILGQCAGLCVSDDSCDSKIYLPGDRNTKYDLVQKHDVIFQSDVLVAVYNSRWDSLYL